MTKPTIECNKCCGTGIVATCKHVLGGRCFSCNGTGVAHKVTRTKVWKDVWLVECEGVRYSNFDTLEQAEAFALEVAPMHLEVPTVVAHKTYRIKELRVQK